MPRTNRRQMYRNNIVAQTAEDYFRISINNDFLSHIIGELQSRFLDNPGHCIGPLHLLPSECITLNSDTEVPEMLANVVKFYEDDPPIPVLFQTEFRMWVNRLWYMVMFRYPRNLWMFSMLVIVHDSLIYILLQLALTLPITSCESERSFSQLKLIKTAHRSTMTSKRLKVD